MADKCTEKYLVPVNVIKRIYTKLYNVIKEKFDEKTNYKNAKKWQEAEEIWTDCGYVDIQITKDKIYYTPVWAGKEVSQADTPWAWDNIDNEEIIELVDVIKNTRFYNNQ